MISDLTYTYDGAGRKATETDQVSGQTTTYHYNDGGWLDAVTTPTGQTTYTYDQNGNMLTKTDASGTTNYLYNQASQLIQMSSPGKVVTFGYDNNGNQTSRTEGTNNTIYAYTLGGKLAMITNPDGSTISYTYDGDGRQVSQTAGGVTTKLYYDGLLVAKETDVNGVVKAEYLYGLGGAPIKMIRDGVNYYYIYNAHGDTIALTNSSGTVVATYSYDPWGQVTVLTGGTIKNPFLYAGQFGIYHDSASGLDLMMTRYYNSSINRFMSPDEFPGIVAKPISHNPYAYVHNDPINNVDPDGHWPQLLSNAWNSFKQAASTVRNSVESAASWVRNQIEAASSWLSAKAEQANNWISTKKQKIYKSSKATLQNAKQKVVSFTDSVAAKAQAAERKAEEAKRNAKEKLKQMVADGKAAFEDTVSEGKERAEEFMEKGQELIRRSSEFAQTAIRTTASFVAGVGYEYGNSSLIGVPDLITKTGEQYGNNRSFQLGRMFGATAVMVQGIGALFGGAGLTGLSETVGIGFTPVTSGASLALAQVPAAAGVAAMGIGVGQISSGARNLWDAGNRFFAKSDGLGTSNGAGNAEGALQKGRAANKLQPDTTAIGAHSVFKRDPVTGKITNYETWKPQTNPRDPRPWEYVKGYDGKGGSHFNKVTEEAIETPHVHDPLAPGGVRSPLTKEIP